MAEDIITDLENEDEKILYGLDAWTAYLSTKPLPARASTLKRLHQLINNKTSTVQQLSVVVKKDPVLTLYVNSVKLRLVMGVYSFVFGWKLSLFTKTKQFWSVPFVSDKKRQKYLESVKKDIAKDLC